MRCIAVLHHLSREGDFSAAWRLLDSVRALQTCLDLG
jgi:pentatricopeptide repeat protein